MQPLAKQHKPNNTMSNTTATTETRCNHGLNYWIALTVQTRRYGHTYVHAGARGKSWAAFTARHGDREVVFSYAGWGRSLTTSKGHKYKVHARYADDDKPVPSKALGFLTAA